VGRVIVSVISVTVVVTGATGGPPPPRRIRRRRIRRILLTRVAASVETERDSRCSVGGRGGNGRPGNDGCSTTDRGGPDARAPHSLIRLRAKRTAAAASQHVVTLPPVHCHTRIRRRNE